MFHNPLNLTGKIRSPFIKHWIKLYRLIEAMSLKYQLLNLFGRRQRILICEHILKKYIHEYERKKRFIYCTRWLLPKSNKMRDFPQSIWKARASFNCQTTGDWRMKAGKEAASAKLRSNFLLSVVMVKTQQHQKLSSFPWPTLNV